MKRFLKALAIVAATLASVSAQNLEQRATALISKHCLSCHNDGLLTAGLALTSRANALKGGEHGPAIVPGNPGKSPLYEKVASGTMPVGNPLPREDRELIRAWVEAGARWEGKIEGGSKVEATTTRKRSDRSWWAFQPLRATEPPMPEALPAAWDHSPIDRFLFAKMAEKGLQPNPPADRRTLLRRLTFNLIGLPPTPREVDAFLADPDPNAYEKVVDRLLASPHYGERWGRHWLDVVRFGESHGYEQNHLRDDAWPYRDYVIRSLNEDKPFSRMIIEQLAGDQLAPGDPQIGAATGFLVAGPHDTVGIDNIEGEMQKRANDLDDMVMATATSFLGLTVNCARCHDHKFDPIEQKDYYRMQSVFAGVRHDRRAWATKQQKDSSEQQAAPLRRESEDAEATLDGLRKAAEERVDAQRDTIVARYRPSVDGHGTEETFEPVQARYLRLNVEESTGCGSVVLDELEIWTSGSDSRNVALAGQGAAVSASSTRKDDANPDTYSPKLVIDGKFDQAWMSGGAAPHWVQIEWPKLDTISRIFWSSDRLEAFGGTFGKPAPELYTVEVSLDGVEWNKIADSFDRLPTKQEKRERLLLLAVLSPEEKRTWEAAEKRKTDAEAQLARLPKLETAYLGKFEQPKEPSFVMKRGDPMSKGELIAPASPTTLAHLLDRFEMDLNAPEGERRLALARWIADDRNALATRVIVNRIWKHHFGNPFVATPSDFGINGANRPTPSCWTGWPRGSSASTAGAGNHCTRRS